MYANKEKSEILRIALQKLQGTTPITSIGPGSVARSLAEVVVNEIGDLYSAMDFNTSMGLISSASGRALDLIGELYDVRRKELGEVATVDQRVGAFYFYLDAPHTADINIPIGTRVFTDNQNFIGEQYTYLTTSDFLIPAGRTRVYASIRPEFSDSVFTAGANTITEHNFSAGPEGVVIRCTNPKVIAPQIGYESDKNYRTRIIKAVRTSAGGTAEAMRFAGLAVRGVRDVRIRNLVYGLGSVEALVVSEEQGFAQEVLSDTIQALEKVRPAGVRMFVREPDYVTFDLVASVLIRTDMQADPEATAQRAEIGVLRYLNTLLPGEPLVYSRLVQSILDASDAVVDVEIDTLRIVDAEIARRNYTPESDQQIIPGSINVRPAR